MEFLFAALVFLIILLISAGIYVFTGESKEKDIIRGRLEAIEKGAQFTKAALDLDLIRDELLSSIPTINKMLVRWSWPARLRNLIAQAGMQVKPGKIVLIGAVMGLATLEGVEIFHGNFLVAVGAGVLVAFFPLIFVVIKRSRRLTAFQKQFPEVIDLLSRSVRAGHSFSSGLEIASTDMPDPVSTESPDRV